VSGNRHPYRDRGSPLDPLLASEIRFIQTQQADVGVGCGPGGPPH
jgi:hypothetical protein